MTTLMSALRCHCETFRPLDELLGVTIMTPILRVAFLIISCGHFNIIIVIFNIINLYLDNAKESAIIIYNNDSIIWFYE